MNYLFHFYNMSNIFYIILRIIFYLILIHGIHKSVLWTQEKFTKPKKRIIAMDNEIYKQVEEKIKNDKPNIETLNTSNNQNINPFIQNNNISQNEQTTPIEHLPTTETDMKEELKNFLKSTTSTA